MHKASSRGKADWGWLETYHTFSFSNYYNPERMRFGVLRVLNDDKIQGGKGFGMHPHDNMEIITIPLKGALRHLDSMGNSEVIKAGEIQVMSAGKGITHSEFNAHPEQTVELLQIWIYPNIKDVEPRYDMIALNLEDRTGKLRQIVSPNKDDEGTWIYQNAWFQIGYFSEGMDFNYAPKLPGNGLYIFVISGSFSVNGVDLFERDGMGIPTAQIAQFRAKSAASEILIMDVPLTAQ